MVGSYEDDYSKHSAPMGSMEDHSNHDEYAATELPPNGLDGPIKIKKPRPKPQKPGPTTPLPPNEFS